MSIFTVREARVVYGPVVREHAEPCATAADAVALFRGLLPEGDEREHFFVAGLDGRNRPKYASIVSIGTLNASLVHPREVFRAAIVAGCASILVGHNHPSGDPAPSSEDDALTRRLTEAGTLLGIPVLDHVIFGDAGPSYSYRGMGRM